MSPNKPKLPKAPFAKIVYPSVGFTPKYRHYNTDFAAGAQDDML